MAPRIRTPSNPLFKVVLSSPGSVFGLRKKQRFPFLRAFALAANIEVGGAGGGLQGFTQAQVYGHYQSWPCDQNSVFFADTGPILDFV